MIALGTRSRFSSSSRAILAAMLAVLVAKTGLLMFGSIQSGAGITRIVSGHDGAEYFDYAAHLAAGSLADLPIESRRHNPGWPLLLAASYRLGAGTIPFPALAVGLTLFLQFGAILLFREIWMLYSPKDGDARPQSDFSIEFSILILFAIGFPTQLYFSLFGLSEPLFCVLVLAALAAVGGRKCALAYGIAAAAALVRAPGILLVPAIFAAELWSVRHYPAARPSWPRLIGTNLIGCTMAALPLIAWNVITARAWTVSYTEQYRPRFGLPFSGFAGFREVSVVRAAYVALAVAVMIVSLARFAYVIARKRSWSPFAVASLTFSAMFAAFHLCLKSLHYIDRTVWTFNYQDRYLLCLWPVAVLAWASLTRPWISATAVAASLTLSGVWLANYLRAALG